MLREKAGLNCQLTTDTSYTYQERASDPVQSSQMSHLLATQASHGLHDDDSAYSSSEDGTSRAASPAPTIAPHGDTIDPATQNVTAPPKFVDEPLLHKSEQSSLTNSSNLLSVLTAAKSPRVPDSQAPVMPSSEEGSAESTLKPPSSSDREEHRGPQHPHSRIPHPDPLCHVGSACFLAEHGKPTGM